MSTENLILVLLASVACFLNLLFIGPLSATVARFFTRISGDPPRGERRGAEGFSPDGPEEQPAVRRGQMSKYK